VTLIERQQAYKEARVRLGLDKPPNNLVNFPAKVQPPERVIVPINEEDQNTIADLRRQVINLKNEVRYLTLANQELTKLNNELLDAVDSQPLVTPRAVKPIVKAVAAYYNVNLSDVLSKRRVVPVMRPRQVAMYLAKELTLRTYPDIGRVMRRDHTSVIHGHAKIRSLLATDDQIVADVAKLTAIIEAQNHG
jgi:chromosomal replication initiation ATPase DnaA